MAFEIAIRNLQDSIGAEIEFGMIQPGTNLVPAPPRFIFGTFPADLAAGFFRNRHIWNVGIYKLYGFDVFGPFVLCKDGVVYACHEANMHAKIITDLLEELGPPSLVKPRRFLTGQVALITGPGHRIYGHWLSDFLPKLYLLHASGHDIRRLRYLLPADTPAFGQAWFELIGVPRENLILYDPARELVWVEELLVPTTLHNGVRAATSLSDAARLLLSLIDDHNGAPTGAGSGRCLFVSRARSSQSRALANRDRIESIAIECGLEMIHPEGLPLLEQVRLFGEAGLIAGEYGSALHNSLFSAPGTIVCALRGSLQHPGFVQSGLGQALGQPTGYVFGQQADQSGDGRFIITEADFSDCLRTLLSAAGFEGA